MGKLPSQPEYIQKESCQAITLRSGKEVKKDLNEKKRVVDNEDEVIEIEANSGKDDVDVRSKNDDECAKEDKKKKCQAT